MGVNLDDGTFIATKEIPLSHDVETERLIQNFEIHKRLDHSNLCRYFGVEVFNNHVNILSEF
jgi:hypothetical protein